MNAASSTKKANGTSSSNGESTVLDPGGSSGSGTGSGNGGGSGSGSGRTKRKKRQNKSKKSRRSSATAADNDGEGAGGTALSSSSTASPPPGGASGAAASTRSVDCPMRKQQRSKHARTAMPAPPSSSPPPRSLSRPAHVVLYLVFFALGTFVTMPLLFSTVTYVSCGRAAVDPMVDFVLVRKSRVGEECDSVPDTIRHLGRISGGGATTEPTLHESMCRVSSLAIGNFVHRLPYARWLVLRNPFAPVAAFSSGAVGERESKEEEASERRGLFRRILSGRKNRHRGTKTASPSSSSESEEVDREMHPLRQFLHHRKEKKTRRMEEKRMRKIRKQQQQQGEETGADIPREVDWKKWKYAMTDDYELTSDEIRLLKQFAGRVIAQAAENSVCPDDANNSTRCDGSERLIPSLSGGEDMPYQTLTERLDAVSWGGVRDADSAMWWQPPDDAGDSRAASTHTGGRLLAAYLKIMGWPGDLGARVTYPYRLCAGGCDPTTSVLHSLEWRQKYRPWCASEDSVGFNTDGFIYARGRSRPGPGMREGPGGGAAGHSMVWYRPGLASPAEDPELYSRSMINALDAAVADSLARSRGAVGRFNVVMDCADMSSGNSPSVAQVKRLFAVLQDHFPDRLGVLLAANLGTPMQILMKVVLQFVTEDVRIKIHIIPNDPEERREMLSQFMEEEEVPYYLGGKDDYRFDAREYYRDTCILPEDGIMEYRTSMPYHT